MDSGNSRGVRNSDSTPLLRFKRHSPSTHGRTTPFILLPFLIPPHSPVSPQAPQPPMALSSLSLLRFSEPLFPLPFLHRTVWIPSATQGRSYPTAFTTDAIESPHCHVEPSWKQLHGRSKDATFGGNQPSTDVKLGFLEPELPVTLAELLTKSGIVPFSVQGDTQIPITGIQINSRKVTTGDLFVCCVGRKTDGHRYLAEAISKGATAVMATKMVGINILEDLGCKTLVLVEDTNLLLPILAATFFGNPSNSLSVIGITGTNGKTTTAHLVRGVVKEMKVKTGMLGSVGYYVDGDRQLEAPNTTPDAVMVQKLMAKMVRNGSSAVVMEVSSIGLAVGRCDCIDFDVAVFMNLTRDHQDFHRSEEEYRNSKAKLFARMVDPRKHRKIVNVDDPNSAFFIAQGNPDVPVVTFGMENKMADVYPLKVKLSLFKTFVLIRTPEGVLGISLGLLGRYNVYNILAAVAVGIAMGAPLEVIVRGIEGVDGVPGRFELVSENQNFAVVVDYAHSPDSFSRLLDAARELGARRVITVFGCAGETDKGKRPLLTKIATEKSNVVLLTTGNPKSENQLDIFDDMLAGVGWTLKDYLQYIKSGQFPILPNGHRLFVHDNRRVAIRAAIAMGKEGDIIFVLARGHELYQIEGDRKRYIDDREECREALCYVDKLHRTRLNKKLPLVLSREPPMPFSNELAAWHKPADQLTSTTTAATTTTTT